MPKFIAAILCGTLIVTFPEMLELTLGHVENAKRPNIAYGLLAGTTLLFCGLIAWYMWLAYKAPPSALAQALRRFVTNLKDDQDDEPDEVKSGERQVTRSTNQPAE